MSPSTPNGVRTIRTYHGQCTPANAQHWALPGARGTSVLQPLTNASPPLSHVPGGAAEPGPSDDGDSPQRTGKETRAERLQAGQNLGRFRSGTVFAAPRHPRSPPVEAMLKLTARRGRGINKGPFVTSLRSNLRCPVRTARDPRPGHYFRSMAGARRVRTTTIALRPVLRAEPRTTESLGIEIDPYGQEVRGYRCGRANAEPPGEIALAQVPLALTGVIVVEDVRRPRATRHGGQCAP